MDDTQAYFDRVADQWDAMRKRFFGEGVRNAAVAAANIGPGALVADVGTGTGFLAEAALTAGARVVGIDNSDGMLDQVRQRFAGRPFEARRGDTDALLLGTDGVSCGVDDYGLFDWAQAFDLARETGPQAVLAVVREAEAGDPDGVRWPRPKRHDDQALVLVDGL